MTTKLKVVTRQTTEIPERPTEYTIGIEEVIQKTPVNDEGARVDRPITFSFMTIDEERGRKFSPGKIFELSEIGEES